MPAQAHIEHDWMRGDVKIIARIDKQHLLQWTDPTVITVDPDIVAPEESWLRLPEDVARALYEALADHFGHSGHDTRALRKDYDAERARVDRLIEFATKAPR